MGEEDSAVYAPEKLRRRDDGPNLRRNQIITFVYTSPEHTDEEEHHD